MDWTIIFKDEVASVMNEVKQAAIAGNSEGLVVCAKRQTSGRGQLGKVWVSPEGGLYCAILLRPDWDLSDVSKITLLAGVAVCEAVRDFAGVQTKIKWPNDLLLAGKKVAGILTESETTGLKLAYAVVGIGINVNSNDKDLPPEAISLNLDIDLKVFLDQVLERIAFWYQDVSDKGFQVMLKRWKELAIEDQP